MPDFTCGNGRGLAHRQRQEADHHQKECQGTCPLRLHGWAWAAREERPWPWARVQQQAGERRRGTREEEEEGEEEEEFFLEAEGWTFGGVSRFSLRPRHGSHP
ncbi:unnamed protein product [Prorocentrum cordatum]|uniref:Uncharacterized protein n=1 Tax=Prorocentrum cordatum TaxID=2364126 RepID=A0ABN9TH58_9DINO|nr:unnamed protein product [Polarella glacialis]